MDSRASFRWLCRRARQSDLDRQGSVARPYRSGETLDVYRKGQIRACRMSRMKKQVAGFSLVEVVFSLAIVVFSVVAILGVFPIGLTESLASINETRGTHLAHIVFASLQEPPFEAVDCFGQKLD